MCFNEEKSFLLNPKEMVKWDNSRNSTKKMRTFIKMKILWAHWSNDQENRRLETCKDSFLFIFLHQDIRNEWLHSALMWNMFVWIFYCWVTHTLLVWTTIRPSSFLVYTGTFDDNSFLYSSILNFVQISWLSLLFLSTKIQLMWLLVGLLVGKL